MNKDKSKTEKIASAVAECWNKSQHVFYVAVCVSVLNLVGIYNEKQSVCAHLPLYTMV